MTNLEKALEKAKANFPFSAKVEWKGEFSTGYQKGTGLVSGHTAQDGLIWVHILTDCNKQKRFIVADIDNENYQQNSIVRI